MQKEMYFSKIVGYTFLSENGRDMPTLTKVACFSSLKGKIDFENLLVLQKNS